MFVEIRVLPTYGILLKQQGVLLKYAWFSGIRVVSIIPLLTIGQGRQDRSDLGSAVKELSRKMSGLRTWIQEGWKRFGRYPVGRERMVTGDMCRGNVDEVVVWANSAHAGCGGTRKSTSGGVVMLGEHLVTAWAKQQAMVAT